MAVEILTEDDLERLFQARHVLENPGLLIRLAGRVGKPFEKGLGLLPPAARALVARATDAAVGQCLKLALQTFDQAESAAPPRNDFHKFAVGLTGAVGGAFGLAALAAELPVTTTLMFRSICDIARSEGEDLGDSETRLQCLAVLALGGAGTVDDDAEVGYFALRAALAEMISQSLAEVSVAGMGGAATTGLVGFVSQVARRFSVQVSQQVVAKSVPVVGAVLGATINTLFMEYFQQVAQAHFTIRGLERRYGKDAVEAAYRTLG